VTKEEEPSDLNPKVKKKERKIGQPSETTWSGVKKKGTPNKKEDRKNPG